MSKEKSSTENETPETIKVKDDANDKKATETQAGIKDFLRIFAFSDSLDWALNAVGALAAIASGCSLAL